MRNTKLFASMVGGLIMALGLNTAWAATAGYAQFVHGSVMVTSSDGQARKLIKGGAVSEGDTVSTARNASAQIRTQDGGFIAVRPDTQLKFDSFQYTGKAGAPEKSFFSLFKGGFRAVTGLIGRVRKNDYRITTPAATIGIRGTDHETFVMTSDILLPNMEMALGTYNKVNVGETTMKTAYGTLNLGPNQVGFVASPTSTPTLLPKLPPIFQAPPPSNGEAGKKEKDQGSSSEGGAQQASGEAEPDSASAEGGDAQQANGAQDQGSEQPAQQTAEAESADAGAVPVPAIRESAAVDSNQEVAQASGAGAAPAPAVSQEEGLTVAVAPPPVTTSVKATSGTLTLDTTAQTVTSGNTTVSVSEGVYAAQAQATAADATLAAQAAAAAVSAATTSSNTLLAIGLVSTTPATSAISNASTVISTNTSTVTAAAALTPADAVAAAANATTAQAAATTAAATAAAANAAYTANGAFSDTTAVTALQSVLSAEVAVSAANTSVQSNAATVTNQNTALATAQTAASAALSSANAGVTAANAALTTAGTQNSAISTAQSGASTLLSTAQTAATAAGTAAAAAQAAATKAATLQAAGDLTGAAAQLAIAQQQLAIAQTEKANAIAAQNTLAQQLAAAQTAKTQATTAVTAATSAANAAETAAATALSQANAASTAAANAASALTATATQLAALQTSASTMAADAVIAAYNNPAVASSNFLGHFAMHEPVAGGYNLVQENMSALQANTQYVLDGSGNLVEMRSTSFQSQPIQGTPTVSIANADIKWSGGTAADTFKLSDNSIYAGRWSNATVSVKDLSNSVVTTYTPANSLWAVLLTPAVGYVQSLAGTTSYTLAGNTAPFDTAGNAGTLNSATLSADFTAQVVNAALNLTMPATSSMAGTYTVTSSNMPIDTVAMGGGYGGFGGNVTPVVSCSGTCAAGTNGYSANVGGNFAGTGAASAGLGYDIWATVSPGLPAADLIQGLAAFTAATPPTTPPPAAYIANHIAIETSGGMGYSSGSVAALADLVYVPGGTSTSGALSAWTLRDFGGGQNWVQTASISGGTATSADAPSFATTHIQYGEWTGFTGQSMSWSQDLGGMFGGAPTTWMYGPTGYVDAAYAPLTTGGPLTGAMAATFDYQLDGATAPQSQNTGLTGTLNAASVTADFVNLLVSGNLDITMPGNENWGATVSNAPIALGMGALTTNAVVTYGLGVPAATCATCSGSVSANFTGQNLAGVILSYNLYNNTQYGGGDVSGTAALTRNYAANPNPVVTDGTPVAPTTVEVALGGQGWGGVTNYPIASTTTTGNLLTAFGSSGAGYVDSTIVTCVTCTTNPSGQVATSGIYYGTWDAGSYSQSYSSTFTAGSMPPSYWITGPEAGPLFLPQALTGIASYAFDAGQVSNSMGVAGVVNGTTTLSLDFGRQTVGVNLDFTVNDTAATPVSHVWNVATVPGQEAALGNGMGVSSAGFTASTYGGGGGSGMLAVTVDGGATPLNLYGANVNGQLTGAGLTGAIISFNVNALLNPATTPTFETVNGVAAFTGTAQSVTTPHRYVSISLADPFAPISMPVVGFYANSTTRALQDVSGNLTAFDTQVVSNNGGGSSSAIANINATLTDYGTDAVSGISWGRWAGGSFSVTDRQTGNATTVDQTINNTSLHWIAESAATSATTLPSTGTYTYTQAGGTLPTDSLGNVGAAPATATLTADFSALTVNLGVSATVAGTTLNATGTNVPIIQKTVFYASSQEPVGSTSHLSVNCTGSCAAATGAGVVIGKFSGAGATGAAMTYGLQNGTTTISGVAAMHQ